MRNLDNRRTGRSPEEKNEGGKPGWMEDELALLGKLPNAEVARRTGRAESAVTRQRHKLGIATALDRRKK